MVTEQININSNVLKTPTVMFHVLLLYNLLAGLGVPKIDWIKMLRIVNDS